MTALLGDWYAKQVHLEAGPAVMLLSAPTLLPLVLPGEGIAAIENGLANQLGALLERLDVSAAVRDAEAKASGTASFLRAQDRSLIASLNDAGQLAEFLEEEAGSGDLTELALRMATRPSKRLGYRFPSEAAVDRLTAGGLGAF